MSDPLIVPEKTSEFLHSKLPIGKDEKILAVYRHHWFAYASVWFVAGIIILAVMGVSIGLVTTSDTAGVIYQHRSEILSLAAVFCIIVGFFAFIPVWLKTQEQVVLTEEALLQILQPSLFANKISQLSLQHIADVSVRQDFFGSMLGFGKISIETPGEQDNYEFFMLPDPQNTAKAIIEAHENFSAALESGRLSTTLGVAQQAAPRIDPQQFQEFMAFQQAEQAMKAQAAAQQSASQTPAEPTQVSSVQPHSDPTRVPPSVTTQQDQSATTHVDPNANPEQTQTPPQQ